MSIPKETRRESHEAISPKLRKRQRIVLAILRERGNLTAQEVADTLCFLRITPTNERNFAAPRLTELCEMGLAVVLGKTICKKTGRTVTVWSAAGDAKPNAPNKPNPAPQAPPDAHIQVEMKAWLNSLPRGGGKDKPNSKTIPPGSIKPSAVVHMKISI